MIYDPSCDGPRRIHPTPPLRAVRGLREAQLRPGHQMTAVEELVLVWSAAVAFVGAAM
jgi:hypothetical protein